MPVGKPFDTDARNYYMLREVGVPIYKYNPKATQYGVDLTDRHNPETLAYLTRRWQEARRQLYGE